MENKRTKNKRMKYISVSLVLVLLCAICVCLLCIVYNAKDKHDINELHQTEVVKNDLAEYGNFVWAEWDKIYRFNRKTDTFMTACADPECDGKCPMECINNCFAGVHNGRLYFCAWQQFTHLTMLAYQDVVTGETHVIKTMSEIEDPISYATFIDADWWYYKCMRLKEGGDVTKPTDYEPYICRISLDGSKEEPVYKLEDSEYMMMAADGKIITGFAGKLYITDAETKHKEELYDFAQNGFFDAYTDMQYYDGKVYLVVSSTTREKSEYTGQSFPLTFLICIDLESYKAERVVDDPVYNFSLTEQGIYYVPFKLRHIYVPDNHEKYSEQVKVCLFDDSLYFCDFDGNNTEKVYTNDKLDYSFKFTVIDNTLYGWMFDYNEETHEFDKTFFGSINLDSGRIVHTEKPAEK